jgi:ABC-type transport system involved in multi-copper enzyme maturation permease subunit
MRRIWIVARITFREAGRKKVLAMALTAGAAFLALFGTAMHFQAANFHERHVAPFVQRQISSGILTIGMYAVNFLIVAMTVLTSVDTLSGEISSGTIQAIAVKPIARWEVLAGKWLGFSAMLTLYAAIMIAGLNGISSAILGTAARHIGIAFGLMWMESMLLLSTTFLCSISLSTLTAGVVVLGLHGLAFLGGWIEQAGSLTHTPRAVMVGVIASLIMPSEALWRRAAFELQSPLATAIQVSPFSGASVPSDAMVAYAGIFTCVLLAFAVRNLTARDI